MTWLSAWQLACKLASLYDSLGSSRFGTPAGASCLHSGMSEEGMHRQNGLLPLGRRERCAMPEGHSACPRWDKLNLLLHATSS